MKHTIEKIEVQHCDGRIIYCDTDREARDEARKHVKAIAKEEGISGGRILWDDDGSECIYQTDGVFEVSAMITPLLMTEEQWVESQARAKAISKDLDERKAKAEAKAEAKRRRDIGLDTIVNAGTLGEEETDEDTISVPTGANPYDYVVES